MADDVQINSTTVVKAILVDDVENKMNEPSGVT
jgi:hypothetical protein